MMDVSLEKNIMMDVIIILMRKRLRDAACQRLSKGVIRCVAIDGQASLGV